MQDTKQTRTFRGWMENRPQFDGVLTIRHAIHLLARNARARGIPMWEGDVFSHERYPSGLRWRVVYLGREWIVDLDQHTVELRAA